MLYKIQLQKLIGGVILRNYSMEKKLDQAKESIKICKFNIENQEKRLWQWNKKLAQIQSKIANISSLPSTELDKLIGIDNKLMIYVNLHKGLILELQRELKLNENNLKLLEASSVQKNL